MINDYRINEISLKTELTRNYIYTCLKKMPSIFKNIVSTGQHNSRIFSEPALEIFQKIAELKKQRMWSIMQIRDFLLRTPFKEDGCASSQVAGFSDSGPDFSFNKVSVQSLIEQIYSLKEELKYMKEKNNTLQMKLYYAEQEMAEQRQRSDRIIINLTAHLSSLSSDFTNENENRQETEDPLITDAFYPGQDKRPVSASRRLNSVKNEIDRADELLNENIIGKKKDTKTGNLENINKLQNSEAGVCFKGGKRHE